MHRKFRPRVGAVANPGKEQLDPARTDRATRRNMGADPARMDHPPKPQVGAVIVSARAFDHLDQRDPGISAQHRLKLRRAGFVGGIDQRRAGAIEHAKRAEPRDPVRHGGWRRGDEPFGAAGGGSVDGIFGDLDRLVSHRHLRRSRHSGQRDHRTGKGGNQTHATLFGPGPLPACQ